MAQYTVGKWSVSESEINEVPTPVRKREKEKKKTQNVSVTNVTGL